MSSRRPSRAGQATASDQTGPDQPGQDPLGSLDDPTYAALTVGQAVELLNVPATFLRSLDAANLIHPHRSAGGHRRYSRQQLRLAARIRVLSEDGLSLAAAYRITVLEDELASAHARINELETARQSEGAAG